MDDDDDDDELEAWMIAVIVCGGVLVLFIICIVICVVSCGRERQKVIYDCTRYGESHVLSH